MFGRRPASLPVPEDEQLPLSDEDRKVVQWREHVLRRAGYGPVAVACLAPRLDIDLYRACALLEQGCDVPTALDILL